MDYGKYKKYILANFEGKRVEEKVLRKSLPIGDYGEYCRCMENLISEGIIRPIKRSGPNGLKPALHKRYQVSKTVDDKEEFLDEIKRLHPIFNIEGYLKSPSKYSAERNIVLTLDRFVRRKGLLLKKPASVNERSFQIFCKEKFIRLDPTCKSVFNFNDGLVKYLNMYFTPEPFFEHSIEAEGEALENNVLIIENKDTWYTLKKVMNKGCNTLYGIRFNYLIYGEGKKITRKRDSLTEYAMTYFGHNAPARFYYFGDLDMEGIEIFERLVKVNPKLKIILFKEMYLDMLDMAQNFIMPKSSEYQRYSEGNVFFSHFTDTQTDSIKDLLGKGRYIPQEILTYGFFEKKAEKGK